MKYIHIESENFALIMKFMISYIFGIGPLLLGLHLPEKKENQFMKFAVSFISPQNDEN